MAGNMPTFGAGMVFCKIKFSQISIQMCQRTATDECRCENIEVFGRNRVSILESSQKRIEAMARQFAESDKPKPAKQIQARPPAPVSDKKQKNPPPVIELCQSGCLKCRSEDKVVGRGLCLPCYNACARDGTVFNYPRTRRPLDVVQDPHHGLLSAPCRNCGKIGLRNHGRGLCASCYTVHRRNRTLNEKFPTVKRNIVKNGRLVVVCEKCKEKTLLHGRDLCKKCYMKERRAGNLYKFNATVCVP